MRGGILLATFLFVVLSLSLVGSSPEVLPQNISSQGSNWETTCEAGNCQTTLYSYEKYFLRNNKWEEIDENWHDCSSGGITTFCTQTYYFSVKADNQGNVAASRDGQQYAMRMNDVTGSSLIFNPVIDGSVLTYQDVVPGFVDVQYQYLPQKLKESIILKTPLRNLSEGDFNISFSRSGEGRFTFERPYICDAQLKCEYLNLFEEGETIKIQVPIRFLNSPRTVYPLVIDPTITLNNSFIAWNGHVSNTTIQADPPTQDYKRYDNPVTISLSNSSRGDLDWNVSSIPDNSIIKNATLAFVVSASSFPFNVSVMQMEKPSFGYANISSDCPNGNCQFYSDMGNGTEYNRSLVTTNSVLRNYTLSSQALTDLHNSLTSDIFSTGLVTDYNGTATLGSSTATKSSNRPVLIITHTYESYNLTYDANGNLIQGFNKYLEYDGWHRVSRVRQNNASGRIIEEYVYDHEGNRLKKVEYNIDSNNTNRTTYYLDDEFINVRITNGTQYNETYYYANDKILAMKDGAGNKVYYHPDHLGSTTLVTNQSGDAVEDNVYLPYGDIYSGSANSRYLFTGKEEDRGTGFDYFGARYYSSQFMHFLQPDVVKKVYDPQNLNPYAYVLNNPYKYTDPDGNSATPYHFIGSYNALRELGFDRIDSIKIAYASMQPDFNINNPDYYREGERYRDYHLAVEINNHDKETILKENAQKFTEAYNAGESDAGRYLHVFGDTIHQGGYPAGPDASTSDKINHFISDARIENIKITKENILNYLKDKDLTKSKDTKSDSTTSFQNSNKISSRSYSNLFGKKSENKKGCIFCSQSNKKGGK